MMFRARDVDMRAMRDAKPRRRATKTKMIAYALQTQHNMRTACESAERQRAVCYAQRLMSARARAR